MVATFRKHQSYFDQVRKRAFGVLDGTITDADYDANGYGITLSASSKSVIMDERRLELRWKAIVIMT